jgi:hypothetical protein
MEKNKNSSESLKRDLKPKSVEKKNDKEKRDNKKGIAKTESMKMTKNPPKNRNKSADKRIISSKTEVNGLRYKKKKFNEEEFQKQLKSFELWEKKRNEKIADLKKKKIQKEIDSVNNKKNIHYKKKIPKDQVSSVLDRLYTKDIEKRRQNKQILTKIYTPSFTPFLYTKGDNITKHQKKEKQMRNNSAKNRLNNKNRNNTIDESDDNDDNDSENEYEGKKKRKVKIIKIKKKNSKKKKKSKSGKNKNNYEDSSDEAENLDIKENENLEDFHFDAAEVGNVMRNRLCRNKSATKRKKKVKFLD